jgi:ferritin-like metal-binding protein YciE
MKITTLEGLLEEEIKDLYSAETQMMKIFPKLIEVVDSGDLRLAFEDHLAEAHRHVERITQICEQMDMDPTGKKCLAMEGLVNESKDVLKSGMEPELMDVALVGAAQRLAHYEIAAYGTTRAHARQLGLVNIASLLNWTLEEEKKFNQRLTDLAENRINVQAAMRQGTLVM